MKTGRPTFVGKEIKSSDQFPVGLRVLVVDDDTTCLQVLEQMLQACGYEVTKCLRAKDALSILREGRNKFDIVISDVHMPDMDGFKLLKIICLEMDLPVVMMSADDENEIVMKGIIDGACDYLVKPVRMEAVKFIWKHVVRKSLKAFEQQKNVNDSEVHQQQLNINVESRVSSMDEGNYGSSNCVKAEEDEVRDDLVSMKKPRMVWTPELHQQFVAAVNQIGLKNAVPKKILEVMNVSGLTRENVASHLQKYRLYLRREEETFQQQCNKFAKLPMRDQERSLEHDGGYNLQCQMINSAQPPSSPLQQRSNAVVFSNGTSLLGNQISNFYNCGIPESVYGMGESTVIESNHIHLTPLNKFGQVYGSVGLQINQGTPEDRFNRDWTGSFTMERPSKLQKLNENPGNKETFKDETICYPVSFSHIPADFPKGLNQVSGHGFSPNNCGGNACYVGDDHGIALCTSDSSYELPAHFVQHFEKDDFNVKPYDEQFVGSAGVKFSLDGYPENNSV